MNFLRKLLGIVDGIYDKFGPIIDLLMKVDITKLNENDRYAFGVAAAEFKQAGAAVTDIGNALDEVKNGNLTPEEYKLVIEKAYKAVDELADLGPAVKALF